MKKVNWASFFLFFAICFWPVALFVIVFTLGSLIVLTIPLDSNEALSYMEIFTLLLTPILPVALILISFRVFLSCKTWKARGWVVYGTWLVLSFYVLFFLLAALGGASMAVVEGVAGSTSTRYLEYTKAAFGSTLVSQILIIPWTLVSISILRRFRNFSEKITIGC